MAKILIVDDNATNRSLLVALLGYGGHLLWEAGDGAEALTLLEAERHDLVITDMLMPTMDGYELVRTMRSIPQIAHTPVIFCTAHYHERDAKELALECGVARVLTKPCEPKAIVQAVNEVLGAEAKPVIAPLAEGFNREHLRLLTDKLSQRTAELTATNLRLEALLDVSLQLASERQPERLLERFCTAARNLITSRYCVVAVPSEGRTEFAYVFTAGSGPGGQDIPVAPEHELFSGAMGRRKAVRIGKAAGELPEEFAAYGSALIAPIVSPTRAYGCLCLFQRLGAAEFVAEDERMAEILSALVGRVFENGRLYERERLYAAELKREMTERRRAQEESAQLADIVQSSQDAIIGMTLEGAIVSWNRGAEALFGYEAAEVAGLPISKLFDTARAEDLRLTLNAAAERRSGDRWETTALVRGGGEIEVAVTMSRILNSDGGLAGVSAIFRDITAQKRLQQQLLVSQKMEAVGRLSAGIAHDFNNLLTVIGGYSALLLGQREKDDPDYADLAEIQKASDQAAQLTRQLLVFSRRQVTNPRAINLNAIVADMDRMLRRVIGEDIDWVTELDPEPGLVLADSGQWEQVVMNLAVNARDAMPAGGKLTLQTSKLDLEEPLAVRKTALAPGRYVVLSMTDTGVGIDPQIADLIFEPFFTTKEVGKGTGLGLSTVYAIVEQSGGRITVYSEPGHGTTFRIFLPRISGTETVETKAEAAARSRERHAMETVLVVEDEAGVRALVCSVLRRGRYNVLEATNGEEALEICARYPKKIHAMITDITMPGMTGIEAAERLRAARPETKVLYMSGYAEKAVIHQGIIDAGMPFIEKPFTPQDLARRLREVLDGGGGRG